MATLPDGTSLRGKLFIVEGIDGSGKSTQLDLLHKWLVSRGYLVAFTEWNSSPVVRQTTKRGKNKHLFSPTSFSLLHAADLADRIEHYILPALRAGAIVLADRYIYTAFARDSARGVNREWVRDVYGFAIKPTLAFYFRVPLDESLQRIMAGRPELKYYEAGLDLGLADDPYESFRLFQSRILEEYDQIVDEAGLTVVDATQPLVQQQARVRRMISPLLKGALKVEHRPWREVLAREGLQGRYLNTTSAGGKELP
jgi:dTMP kinase